MPASVVVLLLPFLLACAAPPSGSPDAAAASPDPDRSAAARLLGDPPLTSLRISPDGEHLLGIASRDGAQLVVERSVRGGPARPLVRFTAPGWVIRAADWSGDREVLVVVEELLSASREGVRRMKALAFEIEGGRVSPLGDGWAFALPPEMDPAAAVLHWLPDAPEEVLVTSWKPGDASVGVRRARIRDGLGPGVTPPLPGATRWFADATGRIRAARVRNPESLAETVHARSDDESGFEPLVAEDLVEEVHLSFAGFAADPQVLHVTTLDENGRRALFAYDLARHERGDPVVADPVFDVAGLVYEPGSDRPRAVEIVREGPTLHPLDPDYARERAALAITFPAAHPRIVSLDRAGRVGILEVSGDTQPPATFLYDRERRQLEVLFRVDASLGPEDLSPMRAVRYPARDGLVVPAFLTVPREGEPRNLPAVVLVHDGPTERNALGWDATAQWLASRGFAVLQPDFRGSDGYGAAFERRGHAAWGGAMQDDLADGVAWLVAEGIADPARVGVFGVGYGGYAALMAPLRSPGVFRAAASWGGITDLVDLIESPRHYGGSDPNAPIVWANPRDLERLADLSPARRAEGIDVPVLLGHGLHDPIVHVAQAHAMIEALERAGRPPEQHLHRGEAHAFVDETERVAFHVALADFFERHLAERQPL